MYIWYKLFRFDFHLEQEIILDIIYYYLKVTTTLNILVMNDAWAINRPTAAGYAPKSTAFFAM